MTDKKTQKLTSDDAVSQSHPAAVEAAVLEQEGPTDETNEQKTLREDLNTRYLLLETDAQKAIFRETLDYHPGPPSKAAEEKAAEIKKSDPFRASVKTASENKA